LHGKRCVARLLAGVTHSLSLSLSSSASPQQAIRIYNLEKEELLNNIRYHDGFMGQKIGPTKCLAFHPYKVSF